MVSSRRMRSSRVPSPMDAATGDDQPPNNAAHLPPKPSSLEWVEPNLRPPAPSFQDYKGYERNHILKHMMPLGHMPTQKEKDKILKTDSARKSTQPKNGKNAAHKEDADTREATPVFTGESEPRASAPPCTNGKDVDKDYTPAAPPKSTLTKATAQLPPKSSNLKATTGPARLKGVVEAALKRAEELNNPYLGKAVEKLWHDSFENPAIAELMDAVLSQKPTAQQAAEFQSRVQTAKKQIKDGDRSHRHSSTGTGSVSKSSLKSPSKSDRGSVARRLETAEEFSDAPRSNTNRESNPPSMKQHDKYMNTNGTPSKRAAKRTKRSTSTSSSTSSLSSISSSEQDLPPPSERHLSTTVPPPSSLSSSDKQQVGPKLHSFPLNNRYKSSSKRPLNFPAQSADDSPEEAVAKRRKLQQTFEVTVNDSEVREPLTMNPQRLGKSPQANTLLSLRTQQPRMRNGTNHQSLGDDFDAESSLSPVNGDLLAPPFADEQMLTRGATPTRLGRPSKQIRKGARVKMSPQKNKGITAGRARLGGDAEVAVASVSERENEDNCAACGGTGTLLCCDSCVRSFHFTCLEPPQDENNSPEGSWFCRACVAQEHDQAARHGNDVAEDPRDAMPKIDGVFKPLFGKLHGKIERSFGLPKVVAEAFEGVKTGDTGEYEETPLPRSRARNANDALADIAKLRQSVKSTTALCFACGGSNNDYRETNPSSVPREIVACDYCILHWHLDCLDPPLAMNPKIVKPDDGKKRPKKPAVVPTWMCPNHVASDDPNLELRQGVSRTINGKVGKIRRPKHATIKDVNLRRGFHNNGLIEILNDPSDTEKEDEAETGVIWRLSEKGIKLDFIDRVKQSNLGTSKSLTERDAKKLRMAAVKKQRERAAAKAEMEELRKRTFAEQQVAMALAQLKSGAGSPAQTGISSVDNLIGTLIQEAPQDVAALYASEETLSEEQKAVLRAAKEHIERLLART